MFCTVSPGLKKAQKKKAHKILYNKKIIWFN